MITVLNVNLPPFLISARTSWTRRSPMSPFSCSFSTLSRSSSGLLTLTAVKQNKIDFIHYRGNDDYTQKYRKIKGPKGSKAHLNTDITLLYCIVFNNTHIVISVLQT